MKEIAWSVVLLAINGVLVAIVGFLLKHVLQEVLTELKSVKKAITELNTTMAVIVTKQDHHKDKFKAIDNSIERLDKESKGSRERLHKLGNDINGMHLRCELAHEQLGKE